MPFFNGLGDRSHDHSMQSAAADVLWPAEPPFRQEYGRDTVSRPTAPKPPDDRLPKTVNTAKTP
ncbi:hypothetical protein L209DRAFT_749571 [Thermothelomyces heterothallicus CBS 203.75]